MNKKIKSKKVTKQKAPKKVNPKQKRVEELVHQIFDVLNAFEAKYPKEDLGPTTLEALLVTSSVVAEYMEMELEDFIEIAATISESFLEPHVCDECRKKEEKSSNSIKKSEMN